MGRQLLYYAVAKIASLEECMHICERKQSVCE